VRADRRQRWRRQVALAAALLTGCGKVGAPEPPLPRGPHPPTKVAARQIGQRAVVGFVVPEPRGSKAAQATVRAELLRVTYQPGFQPPTDPDAFRRRGDLVGQIEAEPLQAGTRLFLEDLRLAELPGGGRGYTLRYGVRIRDRRGRSSPLVVATDLVPQEPTPAPRQLTAEPTADGVHLAWTEPIEGVALTYNVYRASPEAAWPEDPRNPQPLTATEYLDREVTMGEQWIYTVRCALAPGPPYREGEPSETRAVTVYDRFAPTTPGGLVAVQEGSAVRLFWNPNPERDVAGYDVLRSTDGGTFESLGVPLIETPSFLDQDVAPGQLLAYRVVAVDRAEPPNRSEPSDVAELEIAADAERPEVEPR
jgi:hypothetical protein